MRICKMCGCPKPVSEFRSCGNKGSGLKGSTCKSCELFKRRERRKDPKFLENEREKRNAWYADRFDRDRKLAIKHYGGVCVECGESREDALVLHHKNGDGKEERQKLGSGGHYYSGLRKAGYPPGKDVMCGTCHLIHHRKEQREKYEKWPL